MVYLLMNERKVTVYHMLKGLRGAELDDDSSFVFVRIFSSWWTQYQKTSGKPSQIVSVILSLGKINLITNKYFRKSRAITRDHIKFLEETFINGDLSCFYFR